MKKINLLLLCFLALNFFSCSSDDNSSAKNKDAEINAQENEPLEVNSVSSALIIEGATKKTGTLTPTGGLEFTMDYSKQSAMQKNGFEIEFNSSANYAGVYLQLKDENGMADSYFDIPRDKISKSGKIQEAKNNRGFLKGKSAGKENDASIEVNLAESITAGTFCYVICLYDDQGNISEPTEVCVTVEAWAGNSDLVGNWNFTKQIEDGKETKIKEQLCDDYTETICNKEVLVNDCSTINSINIIFNSDGTYKLENITSEKYYDWDASQEACEVIYREGDSKYVSSGKWAYNEEDKKLTLVEFIITETYDGKTESEVFENGDLGFNGSIVLLGSSLKITESYINYDETEEIYEYFFEKK